ncbi:MAG: hypothetical protein V7K73_15270 [Nostoc sp.]
MGCLPRLLQNSGSRRHLKLQMIRHVIAVVGAEKRRKNLEISILWFNYLEAMLFLKETKYQKTQRSVNIVYTAFLANIYTVDTRKSSAIA